MCILVEHKAASLRSLEFSTTWLELIALWHRSVGCRVAAATERWPTFTAEMTDFIRSSKRLFTHGDPSTQALLRTSTVKGFPLGPYGITNRIPMIASKVALQLGLADKLHAMICCLQ